MHRCWAYVSFSYCQVEVVLVCFWMKEERKELKSRIRTSGGWRNVRVMPARGLFTFQLCNIPPFSSTSTPSTLCFQNVLQYHIRITWPLLMTVATPKKHAVPLSIFQNKTEPLSTSLCKTFSWCAPVHLRQHAPVGNSHKPKLILLHLLRKRGKKTYLRPLNSFHIFNRTGYRVMLQIEKGCHGSEFWLSCPPHTDWPDLSFNFLFFKTWWASKMCRDNTEDMVKKEKKPGEHIKTTFVKENGLINTFRKNFIACHYSLLAGSNSY